MNTVYWGVSCDLLHAGHIFALQQCRALAGPDGRVVIGLNTDEFISEFKGHPPVQKYDERKTVLAALMDVDLVVRNVGGADSKPVLDVIRPDVIAVGHDWYSPDDVKYCRQMGFTKEWLAERGIRLHYMDWLPDRSSTKLRTIAGGIG